MISNVLRLWLVACAVLSIGVGAESLTRRGEEEAESIVNVMFWSDPNDDVGGSNMEWLASLKAVLPSFVGRVSFIPQIHMDVQSNPACSQPKVNRKWEKFCSESCTNHGQYCVFISPDGTMDGAPELTGAELIEESIRRMCIWTLYGSSLEIPELTEYWDYVENFQQNCFGNYSASCVQEVLLRSYIDDDVLECMEKAGSLDQVGSNFFIDDQLQLQEHTKIDELYEMPVVLVDGFPVMTAPNDTDALQKSICRAFPKDDLPSACPLETLDELLEELDEEIEEVTDELEGLLDDILNGTEVDLNSTEPWIGLGDGSSEELNGEVDEELTDELDEDPILLDLWMFPKDDWVSSDSTLYHEVRKFLEAAGGLVDFSPQVHFELQDDLDCTKTIRKPAQKALCESSCTNHGRYCTFDSYTGAEYIREGVRRMCIWDLCEESPTIFWDYIDAFQTCITATAYADGDDCAESSMQSTGISEIVIDECIAKSGGFDEDNSNVLIQVQVEFEGDEFTDMTRPEMPFVMVDEEPLDGDVDADRIMQAVCNSFETKPSLCFKSVAATPVQNSTFVLSDMEEDVENGVLTINNSSFDVDLEDQANAEEDSIFNLSESEEQVEKGILSIDNSSVYVDLKDDVESGESSPFILSGTAEEDVNDILVIDNSSAYVDLENNVVDVTGGGVGVARDEVEVVTVVFWSRLEQDWVPGSDGHSLNMEWLAYLRTAVSLFGSRVSFLPQLYLELEHKTKCAKPIIPEKFAEICEFSCTNAGKYCAFPSTDTNEDNLNGVQLIEESVRRLCIRDIYGGNFVYGEYMDAFPECLGKNFKSSCIEGLFAKVGIDGDSIEKCMLDSGGLDGFVENNVLQQQLTLIESASGVLDTDFPLILVNGFTLDRPIDSVEVIVNAICDAFPESNKPDPCTHGEVVGISGAPEEAGPSTDETEDLPVFEQEQTGGEEYGEDELEVLGLDNDSVGDSVLVDLWMSPKNDYDNTIDNKEMFTSLQTELSNFGTAVQFTPLMHFEVVGKKACQKKHLRSMQTYCEKSCTNHGRYCCDTPEEARYTGVGLIQESVRRMCIWEIYGSSSFWTYIASFRECVSMENQEDCIASSYLASDVDAEVIDNCFDEGGGFEADEVNLRIESQIMIEKDLNVEELPSIPALYVGGILVDGVVDTATIHEAICETFGQDKPSACGGTDVQEAESTGIDSNGEDTLYDQSSEVLEGNLDGDVPSASEDENPVTVNEELGNGVIDIDSNGQDLDNDVVKVEFWSTPAQDWDMENDVQGRNMDIVLHLLTILPYFEEQVEFVPQIYFDFEDSSVCATKKGKKPRFADLCSQSCTNEGRYCIYPSSDANDDDVGGAELIEESVRRICLWQKVDKSNAYFGYIIAFQECVGTYDPSCISNSLRSVGLSQSVIDECIENAGGLDDDQPNQLIDDHLDVQYEADWAADFLVPSVVVNGIPVSDIDSVLPTICSYIKGSKPSACTTGVTIEVPDVDLPVSGNKEMVYEEQAEPTPPPVPAQAIGRSDIHVVVEYWSGVKDEWDRKKGKEAHLYKQVNKLRDILLEFGDSVKVVPRVHMELTMDENGEGCRKEDFKVKSKKAKCDSVCINSGMYCMYPDDDKEHKYPITGNKYLEESIRRMCIWDIYGETDEHRFWEYLEHFDDCVATYEDECISTAMEVTNVDPASIEQCIDESGGVLESKVNAMVEGQLLLQKEEHIDEINKFPAILIDGWPMQKPGDMNALRDKICELLAGTKPELCGDEAA